MRRLKSSYDLHFLMTSVCVSWYLSYSVVEGGPSFKAGSDVNIDLRHGVVKGYNPYVSFLHRPTPSTNGTCNSRAVIRVSFPKSNGGLRLRLTYGKEAPKLWTLHVSDSPKGNGFGGQDNTTSNNAELNVHNRQMRLYGNQLPTSIDAAMNGGRLIKVYDNFVRQDSKVTIEISDERFEWKGDGVIGDIIESPFLFTLNGQQPVFGSRDDYIYLGLNRVVGGTYRTGSGLCHLGIRLHQPPQHCSKGTHNCHKDAICSDTRKSFRCKCKTGFHGDGKVCKDEDECAYENGGCVHQCVNTPGSYFCDCKHGFQLTADRKNCQDINECFTKKGGCSHQCINSLGSYECGCGQGYSLNTRGSTCIYGEWCQVNFGCSHGCRNTGSRVECYCREGYYLHSNGKTCLRSCFHGNGGCHHGCTDTSSGPKCSCASKYFLNADKKTCMASCAVDNGGCERKCSDTSRGPVCSCAAGFQLHQDGKTCLDINECETGVAGCSHQCENTRGSFECVCPPGFKVSVDHKTCVDIDECQLKLMCDHECENVPGSFICHCRRGYRKYGITHCADANECADRNGGCAHSCTNTEGGYRCSCVPQFKPHPNKHDCIDEKQCTKLRPRPDIDLACRSSPNGEQSCTVVCKEGGGFLVEGVKVMSERVVNISCGPSTNHTWIGLANETLPECSKLIVPPSYKRKAKFVILRESCDFDERSLEDSRLNLTSVFNVEKKFKCSNRCHVDYFDLQCRSRRKKFKKLARRAKKFAMTAEFGLEMEAKKPTDTCDAFCSAQRNRKRFMRAFKRLRQQVKRRKFAVRIEGQDYKAVKKSLKTDKRIIPVCPEGTELINTTCVGCLPGRWFDRKSQRCRECPKGTYQDGHGRSECKPCPDKIQGSGREAAATLHDCNDQCEPGTFSPSGTKPCQMCGVGTFQPQFGRITCVPCGGGLSTTRTGSKDFSQCISRVICQPGSYYSTSSNGCVICDRGFYQPLPGQEYCKACPGHTTTDFTGATSPDACKDRTCGKHMGEFYGILESPNYPGNYPVDVECVWKIRPEKKRRILIIVPEIDLSDGDRCGDIIIMRKSKSPYSQSTFETCESRQRPIAFTARSKKLWIQFKSDSNNTAKGFSIPFVTYNDEYQSLIEDIVKDGRLYSSKQHQQIFQDRQLLTALLEVIATPLQYFKYVNVSHTMFPQSFFRLVTPKVKRFFRT